MRRGPANDSITMCIGLLRFPDIFPDDKASKKSEQTKYFLENTKDTRNSKDTKHTIRTRLYSPGWLSEQVYKVQKYKENV